MLMKLKRRTWEDAPEEIIQRIQSFLSYPEAIRTSSVSKAWRWAFSTIPVLRINQPYPHDFTGPKIEQARKRYVELVEKTLERYCRENIPIEKFELDICMVTNIDKWIRMISTKSSLVEFHLCIIWSEYKYRSYSFPSEIFLCKTMLAFSLIGTHDLVSMSLNHSEIKCNSLRHLKLCGVTLSDETVHVLLSSLPILEKLIIKYCMGLKRIKVKKHHHLQEFKYSYRWNPPFPDVVVMDSVPCLRSFSFEGSGSFCIKTAQNLKHLDLDVVAIDDEKFQTLFSGCSSLERLKLHCCKLSKSIKISCASLKELTLFYCSGLSNLNICSSNLILFSHKGSSFPSLSFANGFPSNLRTISKFACDGFTISFSGLREVLIRSQTFYLEISKLNNMALKQLRAISLSRAQNLEILFINAVPSISEYSNVLDTLFSIIRPKYFAVLADIDRGFDEFLLAQLGEPTRPYCCISPGVNNCWRHYLRDIEFGQGIGSAYKDLLQFDTTWIPYEWSRCYKLTWGDLIS